MMKEFFLFLAHSLYIRIYICIEKGYEITLRLVLKRLRNGFSHDYQKHEIRIRNSFLSSKKNTLRFYKDKEFSARNFQQSDIKENSCIQTVSSTIFLN